MSTRGKRWSPLDLIEAHRVYDSGLSFSQVGKRPGYSDTYLARRFKVAGTPFPGTAGTGRPRPQMLLTGSSDARR